MDIKTYYLKQTYKYEQKYKAVWKEYSAGRDLKDFPIEDEDYFYFISYTHVDVSFEDGSSPDEVLKLLEKAKNHKDRKFNEVVYFSNEPNEFWDYEGSCFCSGYASWRFDISIPVTEREAKSNIDRLVTNQCNEKYNLRASKDQYEKLVANKIDEETFINLFKL